jgi:hypothetical protein
MRPRDAASTTVRLYGEMLQRRHGGRAQRVRLYRWQAL